MTDEEHPLQRTTDLPEDFVEQVKQVLSHLYDFSYLQQHPLAQRLSAAQAGNGGTSGQRLRREIIAAIEALNPGSDVAFHSPHARYYNLLNLRYLESMSIPEAAQELAISMRQTHRDLRRAEENIAAILWDRCQAGRSPSANDEDIPEPQASSLQSEMSLLKPSPYPTDIGALIHYARKATEQLAALYGVTLHVEMPVEPVTISTDPGMAQQVLINIMSKAIQHAHQGPLYATLKRDEQGLYFALRYVAGPHTGNMIASSTINTALTDRLGWTIQQENLPGGMQCVLLRLNTDDRILLLVDDNEALTKLLDRFLAGSGFQVVGVQSGQEGLRLAQELRPDLIILDVMIPEMNGWELLQRLRTHPATAQTPIVVCSVFNDPELAYSLGAAHFLAKPVQQADLLAALRELGMI